MKLSRYADGAKEQTLKLTRPALVESSPCIPDTLSPVSTAPIALWEITSGMPPAQAHIRQSVEIPAGDVDAGRATDHPPGESRRRRVAGKEGGHQGGSKMDRVEDKNHMFALE